MTSTVRKRTFSLPIEQSDYMDGLVESGRYATASEVVRAGLYALQERDEAIDEWLAERVAKAHEALTKSPDDDAETTKTPDDYAETTDQIFKALRAKMAKQHSEEDTR